MADEQSTPETVPVHKPKPRYKPYEKHGGHGTREYKAWHHMLSRCRDPKNKDWHSYGGRGISVCQEWVVSFAAFRDHMGPCPSGMTLERKDVQKNYEPGNCIWASWAAQARNQRRAHLITFNGRTMNLIDWAKELGVRHLVISRRLKRGWSIERALTEPSQDNRRMLTHDGKTQTIAEWAREVGIQRHTITRRLSRGCSIAEALAKEN